MNDIREEVRKTADEMAERLYRGIAGFTKEFWTHQEIQDFIETALLATWNAAVKKSAEQVCCPWYEYGSCGECEISRDAILKLSTVRSEDGGGK